MPFPPPVDAMNMNFCKLWEMVRDREAWRTVVHGVAKSWNNNNNNKCCSMIQGAKPGAL